MTIRKNSRRGSSRTAALCALVAASVALQGCVPYTSNHKPDPRTRSSRVGLDRAASQPGPARLEATSVPTAASPARPLAFRAVRSLSGPEANITTFRENAYKRDWTPLTIPIGALLVTISPIIITFAALSPDDKVLGKILGVDDPDPCKHGMFMFSLQSLVGIVDSCDVVDSRTAEEKEPTGRTASETAGVAKAPVEYTVSAKGVAPIVGTGTTDADGNFPFDLGPLFRAFPSDPGAIEVEVRSAGSEPFRQSARIEADAAARIFLPIAEERRGDRALAEGKGLVALDHFSRAYANALTTSDEASLRKKVFDCYRSLPVKPPVPEEARRLLVQAEAMAKDNDPERALSKLSETVKSTPWLPVARYNLAMAHAMKDDHAAAIESMNAYLELAPEAPDSRKARDLVYQWEAAREKAAPAGTTQPAAPGRGRR